MRLRTWLLTGSSLTMLTLSPFVATAQELPQACVDAGFQTLDECIAAQPAAGDSDAAAEEAAPTEEAAPAEDAGSEEEVAPEEDATAAEEAAPEAEAVEEAAPEEVVEEPAVDAEVTSEPEAATAAEEETAEPEAVTEEETAPEETAPAAQETEPAASEQAAPEEQVEAPAAEQEDAETTESALEEEQPAETEQTPEVDISADLQSQVDIYNSAVSDILAGRDTEAAQSQIAQAQQTIAGLCASAGISDVDACLESYGLSLPAVPNLPETATDEQTPAEQTVDANGVPADQAPAAATDVPVEPVENLSEGITQEQVAPVLDSAKDNPAPADGSAPAAPVEPTEAEAAAAAEAASAPPPESDFAAQSRFIAAEEVQPVAQEEGQRVDAAAALAPEEVPQNVTVINQTNVVNNTTVNNNTTNIDQSQTTIGSQTNVEVNQNNVEVNQGNQGNRGNNVDITQTILQIGSELIVRSVGQDTDRFYNAQEDEIFYENLSNGRTRETITRPDGTQIITVRNRNGDVLRRSRVDPAGREYVLAYFDDRYDEDLVEWRDPAEDLPPLRLNISVQDYVLDASGADEEEVETFFRQPPVEQVARLYSIDEVKRSARVRDSVRKLEVGGLTFDTGAATIGRDQVAALSNVANGMLALLEQNPSETFLIEGHTDAVGDDVSNLQLSDLRAATVARILSDFYDVPPENLATQGYGERYLKIRTELGERENRRVTIRRITPLVTVAEQ